jgi:hypothetical protein
MGDPQWKSDHEGDPNRRVTQTLNKRETHSPMLARQNPRLQAMTSCVFAGSAGTKEKLEEEGWIWLCMLEQGSGESMEH